MTQKQKIIGKILEMLSDVILVLAAFILAFALRIGGLNSSDFPFLPYFVLACYTTPLLLLLFIWAGLYSIPEKSLADKFRLITLSCLTASMTFVLIFFFNREIFFSRLIVLLIFLFSSTFVFSFHALLYLWRRHLWRKGQNVYRVLIIGANRASEKVIKSLQNTEHYPVAIIAPYGAHQKQIAGVPIVGKLNFLEEAISQYQIDEIIQCDAVEQSLNLIAFAEGQFLNFKMSPQILGVFNRNIASEDLAGMSFVSLQLSPLFGWGQFFKRFLDFIIALLLLPFLALIYLLNFGQVLTREKRVRSLGQEFLMLKFKPNHFLEKTFLIHFPSIWNVFKGEMSLVGPRPSRPQEQKNMPPHIRRRLILKPGLIGLWQLEKMRGAKDNFDLMLEQDIKYIHSWSFMGDLKIICHSFLLLLRRVWNALF